MSNDDLKKSPDDWKLFYYLLDTNPEDLMGPFDEAAFQDACTQIDAEDFPQWMGIDRPDYDCSYDDLAAHIKITELIWIRPENTQFPAL
ncbi:hypothetical protein OBV_00230 [Oscillibacter valericigenes Sjm18-20]|nr:hypothetical protein OBV_00230 [Oscillibacter valericigenes Sjm18-20]